ncbi:MAG TPA: site-specific integrase [Desulfovibrio sp.]|uniref:tyrosine-type recombinase/integrase n=1 Tax=Desulfovibrio sp. TaxID=885 RepID=UPI002C491E70|nr:site-specific integrase [Desulfovibrio sp.]HMM38067.1 site-specific integrase [Desulfovibrio sp.]
MPRQDRHKTKYPGVYYVMGTAVASGKPERIFYIVYRRDGRLIEEKAGRQYQDDMTAARASNLRAQRIEGKAPTNKARREAVEAERVAEQSRWTIARLWEEYKASRPNLKGMVTDQNRFDNYIAPAFAKREPSSLAPLDVDRVRINLLKKKRPGTVKNVLELLRRIINFGVKKQLCEGPGFVIELPTVNNIKTEDLTPEELQRLIQAIDAEPSIQVANFMRMVLFTGMRRGELFKLKWADLDFERGFIHIRDPKGGTDVQIPMNRSAREILESHPKTSSEYVFPGRGGEQRRDINKQVSRIKQKAGLPKNFRALHGLRHVYASMLASSGQVDMYTLQKLLTHKSPQMTQRYAHLRDDALRKAATVADDVLSAINSNAS